VGKVSHGIDHAIDVLIIQIFGRVRMKVLSDDQRFAITLLNKVIDNINNQLKKYRDAIKGLQKEKEHFIKIKGMIK